MKYKVNDVKRILNIKEETLRYYDNKDIIKSSRDNNNYRYFQETDINKIFAYKMYRSLLFSSVDAKQLVSGNSDTLLVEKLKEQLLAIEKKQRYLEETTKHIISLQNKLSKWQCFEGGFEVIESQSYYYHPNQTEESFILQSPVFESTSQCFDHFPSIWPCFYYDCSFDAKFSFGYGLHVDHIQPNKEFLHLPATKCLYTMVSLETEMVSNIDRLLEQAQSYCDENGYSLTGNLYGNILHETKKDNHMVRLFDVYLPIT